MLLLPKDKDWLDAVNILATILIAIAGLAIAVFQFIMSRNERKERRHDEQLALVAGVIKLMRLPVDVSVDQLAEILLALSIGAAKAPELFGATTNTARSIQEIKLLAEKLMRSLNEREFEAKPHDVQVELAKACAGLPHAAQKDTGRSEYLLLGIHEYKTPQEIGDMIWGLVEKSIKSQSGT